MTKTWNGHFTSVSGHFFANYISFHKTEVLKVILKGQTCHNLNWIKSYTKNTICFLSFYFQFCKKSVWKYTTLKWPFLAIFWQLHQNISKNWDSDRHFELLSESKSWLDQKLWHNISYSIFVSCLKMHHFRASLPKWVLTSPKEISSHIFKMTIFPKFFEAFMTHIIR